jgi:GNAT superfamily N-acetyltransferase
MRHAFRWNDMETLHGLNRASDVTLRVGTVFEIDALCEIDNDAVELFTRAGLDMDFPPDHEFFTAEQARWLRSLLSGKALVAVAPAGSILGFAASGTMDGEAYLDQLSVRTQFMRQGIGSALLEATARRARDDGAGALWLTTYGHLSWNRPFYERAGFSVVPESKCGPEMLAVLAHERRWLPLPEQRVAMRMRLFAEH